MHKPTPGFTVLKFSHALCLGICTTLLCAAAQADPADYNTQPAPATQGDSWQSAAPAERDVTRPQMLLLLPFDSSRFGDAANLIQAGFRAAARADGDKVDIVTLSGEGSTASQSYQRALALNPKVIIGPLTRPEIVEIAPQVKVPTLALNSFDSGVAENAQLYGLSLAMEYEAEQMAQQIAADGFKKPLLVGHAKDALSQRLMTAFGDAWKSNGGKQPVLTFVYNQDDAQKLTGAAKDYDAVFLALSPAEAYAVRPLLASGKPVFGTSLLDRRQPDAALAGIRILEMPWFITQSPEVSRYARPKEALSMDTERLYALGVDAYTAAMLLANATPDKALQFNGVTGQLTLDKRKQFIRRQPLYVLPAAPAAIAPPPLP